MNAECPDCEKPLSFCLCHGVLKWRNLEFEKPQPGELVEVETFRCFECYYIPHHGKDRWLMLEDQEKKEVIYWRVVMGAPKYEGYE